MPVISSQTALSKRHQRRAVATVERRLVARAIDWRMAENDGMTEPVALWRHRLCLWISKHQQHQP